MMARIQKSAARFSASARRVSLGNDECAPFDIEWNSRLDDARKRVAAQIVVSLKSKWGTAVALEAATGICQTEMSRIRRGKIDRFSLERLVRLLWIIDPDIDVAIELKVVAKSEAPSALDRRSRLRRCRLTNL